MGKYDFDLELYNDNPLAWIANTVEPESRVLEFGPANGRLTKHLKKTKNCQIDIVEIDEESGMQASKYAVNAMIGEEKGDIEKYYWLETEEKYDFVIFADVLEHLVNPWEVLKRCKKIIKSNGRILVSVPNVAHNSIIIDLINDKFQYNPTGLLDNTHLRFFTKGSFEKMAQNEGWVVVEERHNNIRVGETEIENTYADVPKEVYKALISRPQGNVYQYMFALALSTEYLKGNRERIVSLDTTSYYQAEVQYDNNGAFGYQKSVTRQISPEWKEIVSEYPVLENSHSAMLYLINCNAVVEVKKIVAIGADGKERELDYVHNGIMIDTKLYSVMERPRLTVSLTENDKTIRIEYAVHKYDFDDPIFGEVFNALLYEQQHIYQVCEDYEKVIWNAEDQLRLKHIGLTMLKKIYRRYIKKKR